MTRPHLIALLLCLTAAHGATAQFKRIFNGRDLTGWTIHGTERWYVSDGELVCESGPDKRYGYLSTQRSYQDFDLLLKFLQEADGNSGVFFRSAIEGVKISGWQVEVAPLNNHTGGVYESYGRGWLIQPKKEDEQWLKVGDWNDLRILVRGDEVTTYLNGHEMIHLKDAKIGQGRGFIALQIHDGGGIRVRWKKLRVREL
jgi:hypothetical protein